MAKWWRYLRFWLRPVPRLGPKKGKSSKKNGGIKIKIGYDAVGVDTRSMAAEHCEKFGKQAVWYGHDRNGSMHYKCQ